MRTHLTGNIILSVCDMIKQYESEFAILIFRNCITASFVSMEQEGQFWWGFQQNSPENKAYSNFVFLWVQTHFAWLHHMWLSSIFSSSWMYIIFVFYFSYYSTLVDNFTVDVWRHLRGDILYTTIFIHYKGKYFFMQYCNLFFNIH